ncbi:ADP-ribosylglycohydrolase family protein [Rubellicoccus peritrichatus]|uniref:ADP-ribosylglycohydrolase family protein n=1 Tax=Rubellicoccus peritrichatus TaxID=3080537 RepID=A0AAQ3QUV2_9BACT|nr:ADP-ribosylglycohydrolase family protein [Puniceicoccus sp. CR14]WOO42811.1 ADP-ribosylglycohydrolase family protein [Puniceicoccus sp. CR14]
MASTTNTLSHDSSSQVAFTSRLYGAFWGFFLGEALGVPGHGYSTARQLRNDYGWINDFVQPRFPHPESSLFRTHYEVINEKNNILHGRDVEWRKPGTHYHQNLLPGENALEAKLAALLIESICTQGHYDEEAYRELFLDFMLTPGKHSDTYIPTAYRDFFAKYARGKAIDSCADESMRVGGLMQALPLIWLTPYEPEKSAKAMRQRLALTHPGHALSNSAEVLAQVFADLFNGVSIETALLTNLREKHHPYLNYPFRRWIDNHSDEDVAFKHLRTGASIDDAMPLVFYLVLKYNQDTEAALLASANLGGETCGRGAILGALLGAANGCEDIPGELVQKMAHFDELEALSERFVNLELKQNANG